LLWGVSIEYEGASVPAFDIAAYAELMEPLTALSMAAAAAIRDSRRDRAPRIKPDGSPVTAADQAAEAVIRDGLRRLGLGLPIVSEEDPESDEAAVGSSCYFLVDPLDGTRDFIAGRDEYTINIAIVADGAPILGIVTAPALGLVWRGIVGRGAERLEFSAAKASPAQPIYTRERPQGELIVVVSRSHLDPATKAYLESLPHTRSIACGSSVKFCRIAEGAADHYPRLGPTRDWDIAAGHALLVAAGGSVIDPDGEDLIYGTPGSRIPAFLAWGGPAPTEGALKSGY
jgi:3'(2'), 5'-bisphosphate nucleotidase